VARWIERRGLAGQGRRDARRMRVGMRVGSVGDAQRTVLRREVEAHAIVRFVTL
jgi:hypothetical protein